MGAGCAKSREELYQSSSSYSKNNYSFVKVVGKGGFGRVWKVTDKRSKSNYALKVIDKAKVLTKKSVHSVMNERQLLSKLNHPFLVNMTRAFQDRQNLYLLLDYLQGGDLRYYINRGYNFNQEQIKFIVRCVMEGLSYLHTNNIIHRDIKPQNVIFDSKGYLRITDMGVARYAKPENANQTSGTPGYMAPEVLLRQNHSFGVDYFAVGVIAYELVMGKRPYNGRSRKQIRDDMLAREARISLSSKRASPECIDFINKMIQRLSKKRLGNGGIEQILNHPWIKMQNKQKMNFFNKKKKSPIAVLDVNLHSSLQEVTQPDDLMKENTLLLKKITVQELFLDYEYNPEDRMAEDDKLTVNEMTRTTVSTNMFVRDISPPKTEKKLNSI